MSSLREGRGAPSGRPGASALRLTEDERAAISRCVESVLRSGQTRWIARVHDLDVGDPIDCYARAGTADRFLWTQTEADVSRVAIGVVDEVESAGSGRFLDVRRWMQGVRSRMDWIGSARGSDEATFFGGFAFEATSRDAAEWKSFPAARFFLPAMIAERSRGVGRGICFARVEAASTVATVEAELASRTEQLVSVGGARKASAREDEVDVALLAASPRDWPRGPEFRVQSDRSHGIFRAQVRDALAAIEEGALSKLVLARSLTVDHDGDLDVPAFLARLRGLYPTCTLIAMGRGQDTFLAATPETLVRVSGRVVETAALAGSAPRGRHPEEDRVFAEQLRSSPKERAEHRHVVEAIRDALEPECETLEVPEEPTLRALFGIQHLETPIRGQLTGGEKESDVLGLVEVLHPTPAVGGTPRGRAGDWLMQREGLDRGWYAAPIGWLDLAGGGDFRVALRSGLIRNGLGEPGATGASRALLFAGAGLVAGSDPEQELVETRIKLRALLAPLTEI